MYTRFPVPLLPPHLLLFLLLLYCDACVCSAFCLYGGFTVKHVVVCLTQDLMVDENIMKLEVKRLRDMLNDRSDEVMSQEKRKLQLETVSKKQCFDLTVIDDFRK